MSMTSLWWLLGLALACQLVFLLPRLSAPREPAPLRALALMACGGLAGLAYAWLVRDAVFALGQAAVLWLILRRFGRPRRQNPEKDHG